MRITRSGSASAIARNPPLTRWWNEAASLPIESRAFMAPALPSSSKRARRSPVAPERLHDRIGRHQRTAMHGEELQDRGRLADREGQCPRDVADITDDPLGYSRICLVGSGEFTPAMVDIDREILATIGPSPRVVILPTASAGENPEEWATWGVGHFLRLGARSIALMVLERSHAEETENVRSIERADLLYISGGKPARLLAALEGSPLWGGFLHARREGAWLVGSSAGAMALGDWTLVHRPEDGDGTPTQWMPGLGMLQGMAVVPHFDAWDEAEWLTAQIAGLTLTVRGTSGSVHAAFDIACVGDVLQIEAVPP